MPCPHFKITITQRSHGQSAVAGAAYQSGEKLYSEYDRKTKSYSEKKGIVYTEIILPPNAPPEYSDRNTRLHAASFWHSRAKSRLTNFRPCCKTSVGSISFPMECVWTLPFTTRATGIPTRTSC